ncbi:MAG: EAL domain-containing response regulator [Rhodospirillum sp.]|nr:EAL domain-containing response regulator [Rhodospirillum sp.]MCF8491807.1 EAL domain-containing response regulator [Rhodospirillum sp.]
MIKPVALLIDDDAEIRGILKAIIVPLNFNAEELPGFENLRDRGPLSDVDVIFLDLSLDDGDGVEVLRWLAEQGCTAGVALVSSFDERLLGTALKVGESYGLTMLGGLRKPVKPKDVRNLITNRPVPDRGVDADELAQGIEDRELVFYYQPKVEIASGRVTSAEALVRWNSTRRGLVFPDNFIGLAESSGLMPSMTDLLLDQALADRLIWGKDGFTTAVAVNLSASALVDLDLPNRIGEKLRKCGTPADAVILEVTEATAMRDTRASMDVLTRLRIKGCGVSIDDFGTGYSSLAELHRLPFSELKIDRSFVMEIHRDRDSRVIVDAIIKMAHALDLKVVAEGVETAEHLRILGELGCDIAQGYFFSRPVPLDKFVAFMKDHDVNQARSVS